ncbi:MAG TPA: hypothetical protein VMO00_15070 [Methylomirabilota bacterium]|nr:hypothetical protein [Methylomirabilota bacterium]
MQCAHCGREVRETIHWQKGYTVDYYLLHTGKTEWAIFTNLKEDALPIRYLKLTQPIDIITCVQCYAYPEIRQRLDDDFSGRRSFSSEGAESDPIIYFNSKG